YIDDCFNSGIGFLLRGVQLTPDGTAQEWPQDTTLWQMSTNVVIRGNEVTRCNNKGWSEVISLSGVDGFEISHNHVHHNYAGIPENYWGGGGENIDCKRGTRNGKVFGNKIHDSRRLGIYVEAWDGYCFNIHIYNNEVYNSQLMGISVASEWGGEVSDIWIYNNLIHHCFEGIIIPVTNKKPTQVVRNLFVYNNTVVDNANYGFFLKNPQASNIQVMNNIFAGNGENTLGASGVDTSKYVFKNNMTGEEPLFFNASVFNYRLLEGSPAIDASLTGLVPAKDFDNNSRPIGAGYDMGAFEFGNYTPPPVPVKPYNLMATAVAYDRVALAWQDSAYNQEGFKVEMKKEGGDFTQVAMLGQTTKTDTVKALMPATSYTFRVRSFNKGGHSTYCDSAVATTLPPPVPQAPQYLTLTVKSFDVIRLAWNSATFADGYKIERKQGDEAFEIIDTVLIPARSYNDSGLLGSTTYTYRVFAFNNTGTSAASIEAAATTQQPASAGQAKALNGALNLFPNPANGLVTIKVEGLTSLLVYNSTGQLVFQQELVPGENQVALRELPAGVYCLKTMTGANNKLNCLSVSLMY
ncbi:MAG: T9SS type A sorting domain-containing protein, partial [Bacteroidales bacterium]|nr:T9SS type A sorting domain-containing protein [Bacteroidales bacterium]